MNKLMYRFVATRKKKKKEIDPFLDTVCPLGASRVINGKLGPLVEVFLTVRRSGTGVFCVASFLTLFLSYTFF